MSGARESQQHYYRHRELEYAAMMAIRVLCLLGAVAVVVLRVPLAPLWMVLFLFGMIVLPIAAVMIANDHHPRVLRRHWYSLLTSNLRRPRMDRAHAD